MRIVYAVLCLAYVSGYVMGQSVAIEKQPVTVRYYRMPDKPLDPALQSYISIPEVAVDEYTGEGIAEKQIVSQMVHLEGYPGSVVNWDIQLKVKVGALIYMGEKLKSRKTTSIDIEGREHAAHEFYYEVKYAVPVSYAMQDKNGVPLSENVIWDMTDALSYTTGYYKNDQELDSWWRTNKNQTMATLKQDRMKEGLLQIAKEINMNYGYTRTEETIRFETISKKKHPEAEKFDKAMAEITSAFSLMDADKDLSEIKKRVEGPLRFYTEVAKGYDDQDKEEVKLKHICLYTQALAYYWLEDFDQAETCAKALLKMNDKDKDAERMLQDIESTKASMQKANKISRHQVVIGGKT